VLPAGIPFPTYPAIEIGPMRLMTFGLFVALGVIVGIYVAARRNERFGIKRSETERVGLILVGLGFVGARVLWVVTHWEQIRSPIDVIAVWDGGLQFSGGFITAILVAPLVTRKWPKDRRWELLDGAVLGLAVGQAIGRLGCVAVGEHLGGPTDFFLGWTYTGGAVIEGPLEVGVTYHNAALYEIFWLIPIIAVLYILDRRGAPSGIMTGTFAVLYGVGRFLTDFVRINDERLFGLTGAQYMTIVLTAFGIGVIAMSLRRHRTENSQASPVVASPAGDDGTE
jgi:phosphatidylglycerol:prolipoprotein diacylglycerol transferase